MGSIVTFYSFKGGVGRSMALVNTGVLLARWGYRVLLVDWDLEAPGLEAFFPEQAPPELLAARRGVLDLLESGDEILSGAVAERSWWWDELLPLEFPGQKGTLHLFSAGLRDAKYFKRVRALDLPELYSGRRGGDVIEGLRDAWKQKFDFVLVDSRTGLTDLGGICTVQMPDLLVLLFTATQASLRGVVDLATKANLARQKLPYDRPWISSLPIASRFDKQAEYKLSESWLDRFAEELRPLYHDWLPRNVARRQIIEASKLPYVSYFSFGERIAVTEENADDPGGLSFAYEGLAALLAHQLEKIPAFLDNRQAYVRAAAKTNGHFDVFLSYAGQERAQVEPIAKALTDAGLKVFFDVADLVPGEPWQEQLEEALTRSRAFLLFLGDGGVGPWQRTELNLALLAIEGSALRAVTVLLPGYLGQNLPAFLGTLPVVDLRKTPNGAAAVELIKALAPS